MTDWFCTHFDIWIFKNVLFFHISRKRLQSCRCITPRPSVIRRAAPPKRWNSLSWPASITAPPVTTGPSISSARADLTAGASSREQRRGQRHRGSMLIIWPATSTLWWPRLSEKPTSAFLTIPWWSAVLMVWLKTQTSHSTTRFGSVVQSIYGWAVRGLRWA